MEAEDLVSIHAPVGGDAVTPAAAFALSGFNPRPRVGGDRIRRSCPLAMPMFQSTPPRGGRRHPLFLIPQKDRVSIHAPAWGATIFPRANEQLLCVSIHAPAWGATLCRPLAFRSICVSIHAPAWGATYSTEIWQRIYDVSIHAPAWGATDGTRVLNTVLLFQSTPPRGGRPRSGFPARVPRCFNPRPRVGGDRLLL